MRGKGLRDGDGWGGGGGEWVVEGGGTDLQHKSSLRVSVRHCWQGTLILIFFFLTKNMGGEGVKVGMGMGGGGGIALHHKSSLRVKGGGGGIALQHKSSLRVSVRPGWQDTLIPIALFLTNKTRAGKGVEVGMGVVREGVGVASIYNTNLLSSLHWSETETQLRCAHDATHCVHACMHGSARLSEHPCVCMRVCILAQTNVSQADDTSTNT